MQAAVIKNLNKKFNSKTALNNLSFEIEKGKITGLIGADGAGKTTLLRILAGLMSIDEGDINILGFDLKKEKNKLKPLIGYMPQKFGLYEDLTVLENLKLYANLKNVSHDFNKLLEFTKLKQFQDRYASKLSGGMKQKLGLACALLGNPEFLILDEPSVGVDPISRKALINMVQEMTTNNTSILWSSAYLDEAHNFDTVVILDKGKIIYKGKPNALAETAKEFEDEVIKLMGGYKKETSLIAKNYTYSAPNIEYTIEASNLEKKYGDFYAVKNNTFKIKKGEIFGLLGPNGAGKSTSFKMMCGLIQPTNGSAKIIGTDIQKNPQKARQNLGYVSQKFSLYGSLTIRENLDFFASIYGIKSKDKQEKINEIIKIFNLSEYQNYKSENLPLGIKQKLSMACALIHNPPVLFLDEPTSGVDAVTRKDFWNHITSLAKKGVTILITTHFMDEAEYCDKISLFYKGETIAIGSVDELKQKAKSDSMEKAFINLIKESEYENN